MPEDSSQSPEEESTEKPKHPVEAKTRAKTMCQNTIPCQAKSHKFWMDKVAAASEAKSDEKGVPGKKPVKGKKGKEAVSVKGVKKQKKPFAEKNKSKNAAATKKPAAAKKSAEEKPTIEEKPAV